MILNRHLEPRIKFVMALAQLWQIAATAMAAEFQGSQTAKELKLSGEQIDTVTEWAKRVRKLQEDLLTLMTRVWDQQLDDTGGDHDANVEYDIQLQTKFYLLNTVIATHINCRVAEVGLLCLLPSPNEAVTLPEEDQQMIGFRWSVSCLLGSSVVCLASRCCTCRSIMEDTQLRFSSPEQSRLIYGFY